MSASLQHSCATRSTRSFGQPMRPPCATQPRALIRSGVARAADARATDQSAAQVKKPAGAKKAKTGPWQHVQTALDDPEQVVVATVAPSVRVTIAEAVGLPDGMQLANQAGPLVTALHKLGFDYVFDTQLAADLTIMEEGSELLHRTWRRMDRACRITDSLLDPEKAKQHPLPMFTSCCPENAVAAYAGWVALAEKSYPELLPHVSTCKSPQGMMGAMVKTTFARQLQKQAADITLVSFMPCVRKQGEADRDLKEAHSCDVRDGTRDVDYVLTAVEAAEVLRQHAIDLFALPPTPFDDPLGTSGGGAQLFGTTGGVMEAAVRTVYKLVTGKHLAKLELEAVRGLGSFRTCTVEMQPSAEGALGLALQQAGRAGPLQLAVGVVNGLGEAKKVVAAVQAGTLKADFIEVMACPGGCIGGAGNPKADAARLRERQQALYSIEERMQIRQSDENPAVQYLYASWLGEPGSDVAHRLLHTHYVPGGAPAKLKEVA